MQRWKLSALAAASLALSSLTATDAWALALGRITVQSALVPLDQLGKQSAGMSPAATAFMLRITAANQSGDKEAIKEAFDLANRALDAGNPDGPMMAHALISLPRLLAA